MPFSIPFWTEWQAIHASVNSAHNAVTWKRKSHWCIRIPSFYAEVLSEYISTLSARLSVLDN